MSPGRRGAIAAVLTLAGGCTWLWDVGNRGGAEAALEETLAERGLDWDLHTCHMVGRSRAFTCTTRLSADDVAAATQLLDLHAVGWEDATLDRRCTGLAARTSARILLPHHTPMNGTGLTGLLLVWDAASGQACVGSAYAYG